MASWALFISSFAALALLVAHSLLRRGGRVTAAFFVGGAVFGVLRGNVVWAICRYCLGAGTGATPYLPQGRALPRVGHESLQVVIGWLFASYLAWTLSELVLRRIGRADRLFPTVGLSALFMACIGYCTEATATRVGWWYWDFSTVNPCFGQVPSAGIAAWFSVSLDFIFPVLLIFCSEYRASPRRWLALLVFPLHMGAHALYNVVPFIDNVYAVLVIAVVALALFNKTRLETGFAEGAGPVSFIPAIAIATYLAVILWADVVVAGDPELVSAAIPLAVFSLLAVGRIPIMVVVGCAAVGCVAWVWVGARSLYALAPVAALAALHPAGRMRVAWLFLAIVLAGLFTAGEVASRLRMSVYVSLLRPPRAQEKALAMEFRDADEIWWSVRHLLEAKSDDPESCLGEVLKRYDAITRADPRWTGPWLEWAGWLAVDNQLDAAIEKCRVAARTEPTVGSHHAVLGYFLLRAGRIDEARSELTRATDLGADSPDVRVNLALASSAGSRPDLIRIAAPAMYDVLGFLMFKRADRAQHAGDMKSAVRWATEAAHYVPKSAEYRTNLAVFLAKTGRLEEAVDQCEIAAELDAQNGSARRNLVALCLGLADKQAATGRDDLARSTLLRARKYAAGPSAREIDRRLQ